MERAVRNQYDSQDQLFFKRTAVRNSLKAACAALLFVKSRGRTLRGCGRLSHGRRDRDCVAVRGQLSPGLIRLPAIENIPACLLKQSLGKLRMSLAQG